MVHEPGAGAGRRRGADNPLHPSSSLPDPATAVASPGEAWGALVAGGEEPGVKRVDSFPRFSPLECELLTGYPPLLATLRPRFRRVDESPLAC